MTFPRYSDSSKRSKTISPAPMRGGRVDESKRNWELLIAGDFNERHVELLETLVEVPKNSSGTLYFDSNGGSVYTAMSLVTLMQVRGLKATGIVLGECSSAALLPFAACRKRFVTPHSTHLFHPMKWESEENVRLEEAAEWTRHFQQLQEVIDNMLATLFPIERSKLDTWTQPGRFVTGRELVEAGLAEYVEAQ
ncbi:ATP-dependent Clp protease proteolytic subunit [uncultured Rubinisphaera sp.]|uniref:ATP-dependent Clp protease proteolytic subunit n=1 Tax=uncultured Rubinisphaera sp. TaxID=1678686 RepID=UPI0030DB7A12